MEIKEIKKLKKNLTKFHCEFCDFTCRQKNDWQRHLMRPKHLSQSHGNGLEIKKLKKNLNCICGKEYATTSGLWKHKQHCPNVKYINNTDDSDFECSNDSETNESVKCNNIDEKCADIGIDTTKTKGILLDKEMFLLIVKQNQELMNLLKSGTNNNNSHNINSNNKTFNLQVFLNETCKNAMNINEFIDSINPTLEELENVGRVGYAEGISNIIINKLNKMEVTERPIHCSDLKREVLYIKTENEWNKETEEKPILLKAIKEVANKNMQNILEWQKRYPGCTKSDSIKNDLYLKIVSNSMCGLTKEESFKNFNKIISKLSKQVSISDCKI
jgi:hypothetical protein